MKNLLFFLILISSNLFAQKKKLNDFQIDKSCPLQTFELGEYRIALNTENIQITSKGKLIETPVNQNFIVAQIGEEKVKEDRGSFFFKDKISRTYNKQKVSSFKKIDNAVFLEGMLFSSKDSVAYSLKFWLEKDAILRFNVKIENPKINRATLIFSSSVNEKIYGLGMQFSHANFKGHKVPIFVSEQGIGRGDQPVTRKIELVTNSGGNAYTSYGSIPSFFSSEHYALTFDNYEYAHFDFTATNSTKLHFFSNEIKGTLFFETSLLDLTKSYSMYFGTMSGLPDWAHEGAIVGLQGGSKTVIEKYEKLEKAGAKISGIWIQDWVGQRVNKVGKQLWWNWELDTLRYNDWDNFKSYFQSRNIRILGYINPFLVDAKEKGNFRTNYYEQAKQNSFLVKNENGGIYAVKNTTFSSGILDLSNPECVAWIKKIIQKELIDRGFDGWMADYAEALPYHTVLSTSTGSKFHNYYPEIWAKINREAIDEKGKSNEVFFFSRAAFTKSPQFATAFWLGDQNTNWGENDGIKSAITALNTSSFSGLSIIHGDIGGYTSVENAFLKLKRDEELLMRWIEFSAFTPLFRTHEGFAPDVNKQIYSNDKIQQHFAYFSQIFNELKTYRTELLLEHEKDGTPIIRHPILMNEGDKRFENYTFQMFYFGEKIIVYPVSDSKVLKQKIELPNGKWKHYWSNQIFEGGGNIEIDCPLGKPPVFVRID
jgi:sulfoquinovosidase